MDDMNDAGSSGREPDAAQRVLTAMAWLQERPEIAQSAVEGLRTPGLALPDALLTNPRLVLTGSEAICAEAGRLDAPAEVQRTLDDALERLRAGVDELDRYPYTLRSLRGLVGLRDRHELEPALVGALAEAEDEGDQAKLASMLAYVRRGSQLGVDDILQLPEFGIKCDWGCCLFTCIMCTKACLVCCGLACIFC